MKKEKMCAGGTVAEENMNTQMYSIEDARDTLNRIIGFVSNCDTKASVVLGVVGVILTIIINDSSISKLYSLIKTEINSGTIVFVLSLALLVMVIGTFVLGIFELVSVLIAKITTSQNDSKIYFVDIAFYKDAETYQKAVLAQSERDMLNDLIAEIYINSAICYKKFRKYNFGLKCLLISIGLNILLFLLRLLMISISG